MAEQEPDVQAESSPAAEVEAQAAASAVNAGGAETEEKDQAGVPWKNRMAEMERRHQKHLDDMQAMFSQQIQSLQQSYQPPPQQQQAKQPQGLEQYTDEELATLGSQGHATATQELVRRYTTREQSVRSRVNFAEQREHALRQMYPEVNNPQSPIGRAAGVLYHQYVANGDPQDATTRAMAISNAAAALMRHQSTQQTRQQVSETERQGALEAHQSVGGTSVAPSGSNRRRAPGPTADQIEVAKRIGVKDPAKALERFRNRGSQFGAGLSSAAERMLP